MQYLIVAMLLYILIVSVGLRLVVPYFGFSRAPLPADIPLELEATINDLTLSAESDADFLQQAFTYVTDTYHGSRVKTLTRFWYAWRNPLTVEGGFMHCNGINYILRVILMKSGRFSDDAIVIRTKMTNFFIHQYLRVYLKKEERWVDLDPWAYFIGVPYGSHSRMFR